MSEENKEIKNPSYHIDPDSKLKLPNYHVKMTTGAKKVLTEEEAKMLINMISHEFKERPQLNIFKFEKVGLIVIKRGFTLLIMTKEEKDNLSKNS